MHIRAIDPLYPSPPLSPSPLTHLHNVLHLNHHAEKRPDILVFLLQFVFILRLGRGGGSGGGRRRSEGEEGGVGERRGGGEKRPFGQRVVDMKS